MEGGHQRGMGGGVGRWPMEGGQGGRWGGEECGSNKSALVSPFFWLPQKLATGLIWLVTRVGGWGEAWGGGPWSAISRSMASFASFNAGAEASVSHLQKDAGA